MSEQPQDEMRNDADADGNGNDTPDVIDLGSIDDLDAEPRQGQPPGAGASGGVSADEHRALKDERDRLLYAIDEAQNMRKRLQTEKEQAVQYANQTLVRA